MATQDPMGGGWTVDWNALRLALSAEVLADDGERLRIMRAMRLCCAVINNPRAALHTSADAPDEDEA